MTHTPCVLIILDGFGSRDDNDNNAIAQANTPFLDQLYQNCAHTLISGSGCDVGLPKGQMGNSEVGHLNIGCGRVVKQDFTRISSAIDDGSFASNAVFVDAIKQAKASGNTVHVLGLLSPGGVHSHEDHIAALFDCAAKLDMQNIVMHAFLDGRDTPPRSAKPSLEKLEQHMQQLGYGKIVSMIGRYYAMDRDNRWERVEAAYDLLTEGKAEYQADSAIAALEMAYAAGENDEFVKACSIHADGETPVTINDGDVIIFMNYRADRARQITHALSDKQFNGFARNKAPALAEFVSLTQYDAAFTQAKVAFPPQQHKNCLGEVLSQHHLKQLRIAETEKYAHVTFFMNGGVETPFPGEDRELIPSPKVATYDLQPEMSAPELTDKLVAAIQSKQYASIICNYANPDMVGHTGNLEATIKAIETIDHCLEKVISAAKQVGGEVMITADHGNAEKMFDDNTGQPHTAHTSDPVPFIYVGRKASIAKANGALSDLAPTMLYLLGIDKPAEMTGESLLQVE